MEGKRLDLDAPLISVRRIAASSAPSKRGALRSGYVENIGAVPFVWEKRPGHPKESSGEVACDRSTEAPKLPPTRILINASTPITCSLDCGREKLMMGGVGLNPADCGEGCDAFSEARDALSCNESFSMESGETGLSAGHSFRDSTSHFSEDLRMEEYMMGRFLPAAQAMASGSPQRSWKKPPRAPAVDKSTERKTVVSRRWLPLHYSVDASNDNGRKEDEEEERDEIGSCKSTGYFSSKACGLLIPKFGLKSSFCLLNPVPGMKVRDLPSSRPRRRPSHRIKISYEEGIVEDSWEAVYRHRLRNVDCIQEDVGRKLTTESDSQTPEGSSSFHHSSDAALSPNRNEDVKTKSRSLKTGSFDSCKDDAGSYWEMSSNIGRLQGSGSTSSATDTTHINSSQLPDTSNSNSSLVSMTAGTKENRDSTANGYTLLSELQRTEESVVADTSGEYPLQANFSRVAEPGFSSHSKTLNCEDRKGNGFKNSQGNDVGFDLNADDQEKNIDNSLALSLLPPPLPKPPSDSWLQRTLPSISAKGSYQQSFLGIQFHPRNQTLQASSSGGQKLVVPEKSSKMHPYRTTFAGVPKPAC